MSRILVKHARVLVTMDNERREIDDGAILLEDNVIAALGTTAELEKSIAALKNVQHIDASGCVVLPGLINCHHHLYGAACRGLCSSCGVDLGGLIEELAPLRGEYTRDAIYYSAKVGLCELLLSGATTVVDHAIVLPNGTKLDDDIQAATELGVRFHAIRGGFDMGASFGTTAASHDEYLNDCKRLLETLHDPSDLSMVRIGLGPATLFSSSKDLYRKSASLARQYKNVGLHTHMSEAPYDMDICMGKYGVRPLEFMESVGWTGPDVWYAHAVHLNDEEIRKMKELGCGMSHNPSSNMILGSGIARVKDMLNEGVKVGLGVDGSQCNDGNNLLSEARLAMLLQRVQFSADQFPARKALEIATRGGAAVLGRASHIGSLEVGKAADLVAFRIDGLKHAGAHSDLVGSLLTCSTDSAWLSIINGKVIIENGELLGVDTKELADKLNEISAGMWARARAKHKDWKFASKL